MQRFILTFACLLLFQTVQADCNDDAEQLRVNGQIAESIDRLTECINSELGHVAKTYYQLGLASHERGAYDTAIEHYSHAIDVEPDYALAHAGRGLTRASRNDFDAALADLEHAIELDPDLMEPWYYRGKVHEQMKLTGRAIADYGRAIELTPDRQQLALIHYKRAMLQLSLNARNAKSLAMADLSSAIEHAPGMADAWFARARLQHEAKALDAALADYSRFIELDNNNAEAYYQRATIYKKQRLDHLAIKDYNRALEIEPGLARAYMGKGFTYLTPLIPVLLVLLLG